MKTTQVFCVCCGKFVDAVLTSGAKIYPHREDLRDKRFYQCPACGNYVGTHKDGRPLGTIPTPELRDYRQRVHSIIDQHWLPTRDVNKRKQLYADLTRFLGKEYHTGTLATVEECQQVIKYYVDNYRDRI